MRNSERQSFKRCRFQWALNFGVLTGIPLQPIDDARALRFGDLVHRSLAVYYKRGLKRGPHPARTFLKLYRHEVDQLGKDRLNMRDEDKWLDAEVLGPAMLEGYVDKYGEYDKQFRVLSSEQVFQVRVVRASGRQRRFVVVGTLDGLWQRIETGDVFFKEFKTATAIDLSNLPFDEQAGTYWTYAPKYLWRKGLLERGVYPTHILYTFLRKAMPDERPEDGDGHKLNKDGTVSKKQPSARYERQPVYRDAADRANMHERVCAEADEMAMVKAGILQPIKNPGPLYMPNCKSCAFRDPCELHETGNHYKEMLDSGYRAWDPYAAHELPERW